MPRLQKKKPSTPSSARPPSTAPTAIPALAPVDSPPPPLEDCPADAEFDADRPAVAEAVTPDVELGVGVTKSSDVTLKQDTWRSNFVVSTKVCVGG